MRQLKIPVFFSVAVLALLLASCGFHLRGVHPLPAWLQQVYIKPGNHLPLAQQVAEVLRQQKVTVVTRADQAKTVVQLGETTSKQTSANAGNVTEYTIVMRTAYTVTDAQGLTRVLGETTQRGSYELNTDKLLASNTQRQLVLQTLLQDTAQAIVGHIARSR